MTEKNSNLIDVNKNTNYIDDLIDDYDDQVHFGRSPGSFLLHYCDYEGCDKKFSRPGRLECHRLTHSGERPFKCDHCDKAYTRSAHLKRHVINSHDEKPEEIKFNCALCDSSFATRDGLKKHVKIHHGEGKERYACSECGKTFTKHNQLKVHVSVIHEGKLPHECKDCGKRFMFPNKLKRHVNSVHAKSDEKISDVKTYRCEECEEEFPNWSTLQKHKNSHQSVKMYKCDKCDKTFKSKAYLKNHETIHLETRAVFHCDREDCPKYYYFEKNLHQHIRSFHEGKRFSCLKCDSKFVSKQKLTQHVSAFHQINKITKKKPKSGSNRKARKDKGKSKKEEPPMALLLSDYQASKETHFKKVNSPINVLDIDQIKIDIETNPELLEDFNTEFKESDFYVDSADSSQICKRKFEINQTPSSIIKYIKD